MTKQLYTNKINEILYQTIVLLVFLMDSNFGNIKKNFYHKCYLRLEAKVLKKNFK